MDSETIDIVHVSDLLAGSWTETAQSRAEVIVRAISDCSQVPFDYLLVSGNSTVAGEPRHFEAAEQLVLSLAERLIKEDSRANRVLVTPGPRDIGKASDSSLFNTFNDFAASVHKALNNSKAVCNHTLKGVENSWWSLRVMKQITLMGLYVGLFAEEKAQDQFLWLERSLKEIIERHPERSAYTRKYRPIIIVCDQYPNVLLHFPLTVSEGEAIRQLLLGIGKHLHLCFNKGPLSVIPPQPLLSQDFYAFGHHRPPNDEKKGTSISLLRIEMHPANLNLRLTPVLTQGAAYSNFRTYYISRDVRPSEDSDIYRPYLRKLAELINLELGPRPILVNGIPGSGVNEFRQFLEDKHSIKLNGREFETHAVDLPRRWKQLGSAFQKLKREATNRTRSHVPLIVLLRAPLISAKTSLTEEPELVAQEEWGIRFREQLDTMTKERIAWILYFPNMTRDVSDLQANPGWSSLLIGPLGMHDHDMICEVYESRFPMPPQKHLRALTGGFTGFDKALCEFAETRFKKEDSSGAACLSSTIGKDLFDQALEPILAGGEGSPLLEQIRDFREWLQRNHQGNHIVKRISEALEQKRFRGMLSDGNYTPVTVEGLSPETLRALLEFGILTKDGSEVKVQLSLPFLAATRQAGRKIATLHIAFPGELRGVTKQLHEKLQKSGCVNYFYPELPPEKLTEGWKTRERKSVRASDGFLLVYGARVASSAFSGFLFEECQLAEQLNKDRLLVLVDGRKDQGLPSLVAEWQSIEPCEPWPDKAAQKIVEWVLTREDELTR